MMTTHRAGRRPSNNVFRVLSLQWIRQAYLSRAYHASMFALRLHYSTQAHLAEIAPEPIVRQVTELPRSRPVAGPRRAWDTDALRANARTVLNALAALADANPHSAGRDERKRADLTPPAALLNNWRIVRLCRRYPEVGRVVDKIRSQAPACAGSYTRTRPTVGRSPAAESTAERAEHRWRDKHFPAMSLLACELRAQARLIYGTLSLQAEREGESESRLSGYLLQRPKTGHSAPDSAYVKIQRYPRRRAIRAWIKFCETADIYMLCYGTPNPNKRRDDEIVTAADRERRYQKRVRKAMIRAATGIAQTAEGLTALEKILAAARERMGMAS